jgi:hypothetical protein
MLINTDTGAKISSNIYVYNDYNNNTNYPENDCAGDDQQQK